MIWRLDTVAANGLFNDREPRPTVSGSVPSRCERPSRSNRLTDTTGESLQIAFITPEDLVAGLPRNAEFLHTKAILSPSSGRLTKRMLRYQSCHKPRQSLAAISQGNSPICSWTSLARFSNGHNQQRAHCSQVASDLFLDDPVADTLTRRSRCVSSDHDRSAARRQVCALPNDETSAHLARPDLSFQSSKPDRQDTGSAPL